MFPTDIDDKVGFLKLKAKGVLICVAPFGVNGNFCPPPKLTPLSRGCWSSRTGRILNNIDKFKI